MRLSKPCFALGCAIILFTSFGCASSHRSIALAETAPPAVARANHALVIEGDIVNGRSLTVLTYNMQRQDRLDGVQLVAQHLKTDAIRQPDFILCQEVLFNHSKSAAYRSSAEMLARQLGYYADGSQRRSGREGVAIVSKYPFAFFEAKQLDAGSWIGFPRVSVMGEFIVPSVGRVRVIDIHLTHWGFEHSERTAQLEETLTWVASREESVHADVTILGGDFNALADSPEMSVVNDSPPDIDFSLMNFNSDEPTKGGHGHWHKRIDYIFAAAPNRDLRFEGETLLWPDGIPRASGHGTFWPSDHLLVMHEYEVGSLPTVVQANTPVSIATAVN